MVTPAELQKPYLNDIAEDGRPESLFISNLRIHSVRCRKRVKNDSGHEYDKGLSKTGKTGATALFSTYSMGNDKQPYVSYSEVDISDQEIQTSSVPDYIYNVDGSGTPMVGCLGLVSRLPI